MSITPAAQPSITNLRASIAQVSLRPGSVLPFGVRSLDERLAQGGLAQRALHDVSGASASSNDDAAATLFLAGVTARFASVAERTVLWMVPRADLARRRDGHRVEVAGIILTRQEPGSPQGGPAPEDRGRNRHRQRHPLAEPLRGAALPGYDGGDGRQGRARAARG